MGKDGRPNIDWTNDAKLPERYAKWEKEMRDEILLYQGDGKKDLFLVNYIKVCSGEEGQEIIEAADLKEEKTDWENFLPLLKTRYNPHTMP